MTNDEALVACSKHLTTFDELVRTLQDRRNRYEQMASTEARESVLNMIDIALTYATIAQSDALRGHRYAYQASRADGDTARLKASLNATFGTGSNARGLQYLVDNEADVNDFGITSHTDTPALDEAA